MTLQNFISQTSKFIEKSGIDILFPVEVSEVEYPEHGFSNMKFSMVDSFCTGSSINDNTLLQIIIVFSLLDTHVDKLYPTYEGESFKRKFENLPFSSDEEIILKNIFRIFKTLRNSIIHNISSTTVTNSDINMFYTNNRGTNISVVCEKKGLSSLFTIVYMISNNLVNTYRNKMYLNTFYVDMKSNLIMEDEITDSLDELTNSFVFKSISRIRIKLLETQYEVQDLQIIFKNQYLHGKRSQPYLHVDLLFKIDNEHFLVPEELIENDSVLISDIQKWKII